MDAFGGFGSPNPPAGAPSRRRHNSISLRRGSLGHGGPPAEAAAVTRSIHEQLAASRGARTAARWRAQQTEWAALRASLGRRLGRGVGELTLTHAEEWRAMREVSRRSPSDSGVW
jgi:hypothetical protein